jgi:hypothetical protein
MTATSMITTPSTKLLVIGQRDGGDDVLDEVANRVANSSTTIVRRCNSPEYLIDVVGEVYEAHGKIDSLDLYDHGRPGSMHMGQPILFASDKDPKSPLTGGPIVERIVPFLSELAQLRLLGCDTADILRVDLTEGRLLLLKLAKRMRPRQIVFGTLAEIEPDDFDGNGFRDEKEVELLFSSRAALDVEVPTYRTHMLNLNSSWLAVTGRSTGPRSEPQRELEV